MIYIDAALKVVLKSLEMWDKRNSTRYARRYKALQDTIARESGKPTYGELPPGLKRDQSKIDKAELEIERLLKGFLEKEHE